MFIFGSCVTRDTFAYLDPQRYLLAGYVARQSWASVAHPPGDVVDVRTLPSAFQQRVVRGALHGDVLGQLDASGAVDLVLLDLTDERLGLHRSRDGGFVTRSVELVTTRLEERYAAGLELVTFGSRKHRRAWAEGADVVLAGLTARNLLARTYVLAPPWAATSTAGHRGLRSVRTTPAQFARRLRPYLDVLASRLGDGHVLGQHVAVQADPEHAWGLAPFHYSPAVYRALAAEIDAATEWLDPSAQAREATRDRPVRGGDGTVTSATSES